MNKAFHTKMQTLPPELAELILERCELREMLMLTATCHQWRALIHMDSLWKRSYTQIIQPLVPYNTLEELNTYNNTYFSSWYDALVLTCCELWCGIHISKAIKYGWFDMVHWMLQQTLPYLTTKRRRAKYLLQLTNRLHYLSIRSPAARAIFSLLSGLPICRHVARDLAHGRGVEARETINALLYAGALALM